MTITLIVDTGQDIVGVLSVPDGGYTAYRGAAIQAEAIVRISQADQIITYNGSHYDLFELGRAAELSEGQPIKLRGTHIDMRAICWSNRIWGKSLRDTYSDHFDQMPTFPDTHEGRNYLDVYMTWKLWELWQRGQLKVVDGHYR